VLCREEVYCPDGKVPLAVPGGNNILELLHKNGDLVDKEHWAPIGDVHNGWVQIGEPEGEACKTYHRLSHKDPSWGLSGINIFEVTGYLMCCLEPPGMHGSLPTMAATTTTAATTSTTHLPPSKNPTPPPTLE